MTAIEVELTGKIKLVILSGSPPIADHPDEGKIVRGYIEFGDVPMPSGKTFRQEIKDERSEIRTSPRVLDDAKPLRWPIFIGELSSITQDEIRE
jgi:hypothetical protein